MPVSAPDCLLGDDVVKHYDGVRAVRGVSIQVRRGQIVGLIGPNGSGKTTLLNCLSGALRPTAGRIIVDGIDCTGVPAHGLARMGVARTFQNIRLFGSLSVRENVEVAIAGAGRGNGTERTARALELLDEVGGAELASRSIDGLPYGSQRRVELARAIAAKPSYLLLDEPAAGMDEGETDDLLRLLRDGVNRWGCGLLVIDHDLRLIMGLCQQIHVLNEGESIAVGPPDVVRQDERVVAAYLGTDARGREPHDRSAGHRPQFD